jgi:rubrerythrin
MVSELASRSFAAGPSGHLLLRSDRVPEVRSVRELVGIAKLIEAQAIHCYRTLARQMARRGHAETARAFLRMAAEAEAHAATVDRLTDRVDIGAGDTGSLGVLLPEFAVSWDDVRESALLTPYRALALAVKNEQRAFAFYSYLAARAQDPAVAKEAERLGLAKLGHAAALRRWRRAAYRDERAMSRLSEAESPDEVIALLPQAERDIAIRHRALAHALELAGDEESAGLLRSAARVPFESLPATESDAGPGRFGDDPIRLLTEAQKPLERLAERIEAALGRRPDEAALAELQAHLERTVRRLNVIKRRVRSLMRAERSPIPSH